MATNCPRCNQPDPLFSKKRQVYICEDCGHEYKIEEPFQSRRIFISYGHDEHISLATRLRDDLRERGHEVWFDEERLRSGADWEEYIEAGLSWTAENRPHAAVILLLTPHSVRRPDGFCLNEVARALMLKLRIIPLMVVESEPPLSICRIQWLDMRECIPIHEKEALYEPRFERLLAALEGDRLDYEGLQSRLIKTLQPIEFSADLLKLLKDFTGRKWVVDEVDAWFDDPEGQKVFFITGEPGVGKSAVAAWIRENRREVAAFHFCDISSEEKRNPAKMVCSIVYQLSTQLPEYQKRLGQLDLESIVQEYHEAYTLFDKLLVQPLSENFPAPDRTITVLIDALDEATSAHKNEIALFLSRSVSKTPPWLRFLVTSRPEPEIMSALQALKPCVLDTTREENLADLKAYIYKQIPEATPVQAEEIIKRSEGLFLYVSHVAAGIREKTLDLKRIDQFPRGLGEVYYQFFERQFGQDLVYYEEKIIPLLQVILAAFEPLRKKAIKEICKIDTDTELERRLNRLGSLFPATGEGDSETIRPFHRSISEWITDRSNAGHYVVALSDGHQVLAEHCWQEYLAGVEAPSDYALQFLPLHMLRVGRWDQLIGDESTPGPLTDLRFIQAKCKAGLSYELVSDYNLALAELPEFRKEQEYLCEHEQAMRAYNRELKAYAVKRYDYLQLREKGEACIEPPYPEMPAILSDENLTPLPEESSERAARLRHFANFVFAHTRALQQDPQLTAQIAYNSADDSPVVRAGKDLIAGMSLTFLLRYHRPPVPPFRPQHLRTMEGHSGGIQSVSVTPDGKRAVSGSDDKTLRLWNLENGECLHALEGHNEGIQSVNVTPDGKKALSGSKDNTLRFWDLENGECLRTFEGHNGRVRSVSVTPDGKKAVSGGEDKTLRLWDLEGGEFLRKLEGHGDWIECVSVTPDGKRAVSGSRDNTLRLWDLASGECLNKLEGHKDWVRSVSVTPDGKKALSGSDDKTLRLWDLENGKCLCVLENYIGGIQSVSVSPDGRKAVSGSDNKTLRLWDLESGECLCTLEGHSEGIRSVIVTPDGKRAVSGGWDETIRLWDLDNGERQRTLEAHNRSVQSVRVTPNGKHVLSGSRDKTLCLWGLENGDCLHTLEGHKDWIECASVTPDGKQAVSGGNDKTLRLWDLESGDCLQTLEGHSSLVECLSVTPDGKRVVSGSWDETLRLWDLENGECLHTLEGHNGGIQSVSVAPDGKKAVSGSWDKTLRLWDLENGECLQTLEGHSSWVRSVRVSPDGKRVVSGSWDETLRFWNLENGECLQTLEGHSSLIDCVSVTSDGKRAVSGSRDETLRLWDLESGECLCTLEGHRGIVQSVIVTPDGKRALSGSLDKTLRLWDLESGECIAVYHALYVIMSAAVSLLNDSVVCGTEDGQVHFLKPVNFPPPGPAMTTAVRLWLFGDATAKGCWDDKLTALCPWCGRRFVVDDNMPGEQVSCLFNDCAKPIVLNQFIVNNQEA